MNRKCILVLVDGMASFLLEQCKHPFFREVLHDSVYNLKSTTVMPSVTLPCHMSLFHSVEPQRHGILTNTYVPQVRPVVGLFEQLHKNGKKCASFYNWEELRDLSRPDTLAYSCCMALHQHENTDAILTQEAMRYIGTYSPDFVFLYLGETDEKGHNFGWGSEQYGQAVNGAWDCIEKLFRATNEEYHIIITADHGGHDQTHGTEDSKDMQIPIIITGVCENTAAEKLSTANICDLAPTVTGMLDVPPNPEWVGQSLL